MDAAARTPKEIVRAGYDAISYQYRDDLGSANSGYAVWLRELRPLLSPGARVLDLGCGCGIPATKLLAAEHQVLAIDISQVQIDRARQLVPGAEFRVGDIAELSLEAESFDAIVSFFAIIHLPVEEQPDIFRRIYSWLVPGGWLLATLGHRAWTGTEESWHGAEMYWSHGDEATYRTWLQDLGFEIQGVTFIPEGDGGHSLFLALKV